MKKSLFLLLLNTFSESFALSNEIHEAYAVAVFMLMVKVKMSNIKDYKWRL